MYYHVNFPSKFSLVQVEHLMSNNELFYKRIMCFVSM